MELIKQNSQTRIFKSLIVIFLGSILLAISAKVKIPFYPVPMTMQTFVVLFLGLSFGYKIGLATVSLYLIEGIIGLPVFSNSPERGIGLVYFTGPTMGYLVGFLFACLLASFVKLEDNYGNIQDIDVDELYSVPQKGVSVDNSQSNEGIEIMNLNEAKNLEDYKELDFFTEARGFWEPVHEGKCKSGELEQVW